MTGRSWGYQYSKQFIEGRDRYKSILNHRILASGVQKFHPRRSVESTFQQADIFDDFLADFSLLVNNFEDPIGLPPAIDEAGEIIQDYFCFRRNCWIAYIYRDISNHSAIAELLLNDDNRPEDLREALRATE